MVDPPLSLAEKASLIFRVLIICKPLQTNLSLPDSSVSLTVSNITGPFYLASNVLFNLPLALLRGIPLRPALLGCIIRTIFEAFPGRHIQTLLPPDDQVYRSWIANKRRTSPRGPDDPRLREDIEAVPGTGARLLWLGDRRTATKFVLFIHGGGFVMPMTSAALGWAWTAYIDGGDESSDGRHEETTIDVAVAVLQYTLVPAARQPEQLREAVEALRFLLQEHGIAPEDLLIGGDSAGGNLTAQTLRHAVDPHPRIPPLGSLLGGGRRLAGAFLVSPVVTERVSSRSYRDNHRVDMLTGPLVRALTDDLIKRDPAIGDDDYTVDRAFLSPLEGDLGWLGKWGDVVRAVYLTAGRHEVFHDDVVAFAGEVARRNPGVEVQLDVGGNAIHDDIILEQASPMPRAVTEKMRRWARGRF
ncbi:hypothetical protein ACRALDRAFT_2123891 [Sodiomyces alcalophilus JCM 7366]|uniref:uncharacterized protein n=1 Tax=Sodiomyces alcalophilus JCM 7366 TaxID=591952 RepID=UPI0039B52B7D